MTEYITKEQALYIASYAANTGNLDKARKLLDVAPTADVMEVAHAYWDGVAPVVHAEDENGEMQIVYDVFECSRCGCIHLGSPNARWEYCPNCGARMDLELPMCEKEGEGK